MSAKDENGEWYEIPKGGLDCLPLRPVLRRAKETMFRSRLLMR